MSHRVSRSVCQMQVQCISSAQPGSSQIAVVWFVEGSALGGTELELIDLTDGIIAFGGSSAPSRLVFPVVSPSIQAVRILARDTTPSRRPLADVFTILDWIT